jgi:hypothetical protein
MKMFRFAQHDSGIDKSVIQKLCGFGRSAPL